MNRDALRQAFEIGRHPLTFAGAERCEVDGIVVEQLRFATQGGAPVRGILTRPDVAHDRRPAVLYIHAHGARYDIGADELLDGRPALQAPLGPIFARLGFVTLAIDLPTFGRRASEAESALAKALLWHGRSLAGQMLGELHSAMDYLGTRADVAPGRIGCFGISMGATFGYWLAAVDPRLAAVAQLCCFADFDELIAAGAHDLHGIYLTIPGLLDIADNGTIAGLVAPRPQLICLGGRDPLTPEAAVATALGRTRSAYAAISAGDKLVVLREPDAGHEETPAMRERVLSFLSEHLKP